MHELTRVLKGMKVSEPIERRLLKRVRSHLRKDRARIKAGTISKEKARKKAEIAAVEELLEQTNADLGKL